MSSAASTGIGHGSGTHACPRKLEIKGWATELSQKHLQRIKDDQVRGVQEDTEAIVPKEARVCIGWTGLKHKTTKDRGRGKTTVGFWFSTLHRHYDDKGLENGETRLGIPELQSEWRDSEGEFGVQPSKKTVGQSTDEHQETKGASGDKGVRSRGQERYFVTSAMLSLQHWVGHRTNTAD